MFCFLFNLHYVAILSAAKLSDFFHPLIHQREMTPAIILSALKGDYYGTAVIPKMIVCCAVGNKYKFLLFSYFSYVSHVQINPYIFTG